MKKAVSFFIRVTLLSFVVTVNVLKYVTVSIKAVVKRQLNA